MRRLAFLLLCLVSVNVSCKKTATQFSELPVEDPDLVARIIVDSLIFEGKVYPVTKFRNVTGPECDGDAHWHSEGKIPHLGTLGRDPVGTFIFVCAAPAGERADFVPFPVDCREDSAPRGCGHGKVSEVTRQQVQLFQDCLDAYPRMVCK